MSNSWRPPVFSTEAWYSDPGDHHCPRDAWLESVEVRSSPKEARERENQMAVTLKLQGAYHDGRITFSYSGVRRHSLPSYLCDQGVGDWLRDEFIRSEAGLTLHRITWHSCATGPSHWEIEAREVKYEWSPKAG